MGPIFDRDLSRSHQSRPRRTQFRHALTALAAIATLIPLAAGALSLVTLTDDIAAIRARIVLAAPMPAAPDLHMPQFPAVGPSLDRIASRSVSSVMSRWDAVSEAIRDVRQEVAAAAPDLRRLQLAAVSESLHRNASESLSFIARGWNAVSGWFTDFFGSSAPAYTYVRDHESSVAAAGATQDAEGDQNASAAQSAGGMIATSTDSTRSSQVSAGQATVINRYITQPVIERIIERNTVAPAVSGANGVSQVVFESRIAQLERAVDQRLASLSAAARATYIPVTTFGPSQRIDNLAYTSISNPTITGGSITAASITGTISNVLNTLSGTITSLTGTDLTYTGGTFTEATSTTLFASKLTVPTATVGTITATSSTASSFIQASSSRLSVFGTAYFGGTSTTTIDASGSIILPSTALLTAPYASSTALTLSGLGYFNGGMLALASSTVGSGTQAGGLTISGGATTTGNVYFGGSLGIGTTSPSTNLSVQGNALFSGNLTAANLTATGTVTTAGLTNTGTFSQAGLASFVNASTSLLSVFQKAYFGGAATTTIDSTGAITVTSGSASTFPYASSTAFSVSGTGYFGTANVSGLTASQLVFTDASKNLASTGNSAAVAAAVSDETGSGSLAFANSPTFTTPNLGTPSAATLTNATGLPISTGVSGLGTGVATALGVNVGSAGAFVTFNGALGTPSSGTLTNATGLPIGTGVSGLGTGIATWLATPSSANLASAVTDETGTGSAVFSASPTFTGTITAAALNTSGAITSTATTANTFPYASSTAVTVSGNGYFPGSGIWNSSGSVGIGTNAPGALLNVVGSDATVYDSASQSLSPIASDFVDINNNNNPVSGSNFSSIYFRTRSSLTSVGRLSLVGSGDTLSAFTFQLRNGGSVTPEIMRITSSGSVGIGTTSPMASLTASFSNATATNYPFVIDNTNSGGSARVGLLALRNGSKQFDIAEQSGEVFLRGFQAEPLNFYTNNSATANMTISSTGNVGIGTTTPNNTLSVVGTTEQWIDSATNYRTAQIGSGLIGLLGPRSNPNYFLTYDVTNKRIGVGPTTTPLATLSVQGAGTGTGINFQTTNSSASPLFTIFDSGNVGIGTTTPWGKLSVTGAGTGTGVNFLLANSANTPIFKVLDDGTATLTGTLGISGAITSTATAANVFPYASSTALTVSGNAYFPGSGIWNSSGNVGIGTTTVAAGYKASVFGSFSQNFTGGAAGHDIIDNTTGYYVGVLKRRSDTIGNMSLPAGSAEIINYNSGGTGALGIWTHNYLAFGTNGASERMRIDSSGNVGIGTTTPGSALDVVAASAAAAQEVGSLRLISSADNHKRLYFGLDSTNNYGWLQSINIGSTYLPTVINPQGGNVGIGTTSPATTLSVAGDVYATGGLGVGVLNTTAGTLQTSAAATIAGTISGTNTSASQALFTGWTPVGTVSNASGSFVVGQSGYSGLNVHTNADANTTVYLDNIYNSAGAQTIFRGRQSGTPVTQLTLTGAGNVTVGNNLAVSGATGTTTIGSGQGFTIGSSQFVLQQGSGNVGIGTASPGGLLDVRQDQVYAANTNGSITASGATVSNKVLTMGVDTTSNFGWINAVNKLSAIMPLSLNPQGGKVGIGITDPTSQLEVKGSSGLTLTDTAALGVGVGGNVTFQGTYNGTNYTPGASISAYKESAAANTWGFALQFNTRTDQAGAVAERMRISSTGNVGIGTAGPGNTLTVNSGNSSLTSGILQSGATTGYSVMRVTNTGGSAAFGVNDSAGNIGATDGLANATLIGSLNSTPLQLLTNDTARLTIDTSGNVGIGTTSPMSKLTVSGVNSGITVSGGGNYVELYVPGQSHWRFKHLSNSLGIQNSYGGGTYQNAMVIEDGFGYTVNTELLRLKFDGVANTGRMGVATTSPWGRLSVRGYGAGSDPAFVVSDGSDATRFLIQSNGNVGIGTTTPWRTLSVTGTVGFDGLTGAFGAGSLCLTANKEVVYNSGSDSCLSSLRATKHNIQPLSLSAIDMVKSLQPVSFVYNNDASSTVRYGFIAEDAAAVDSHLGTYDQNGNISGVDDRSMLAIVVKALQSLIDTVDNFANSFTTKELTFVRATGDEIDVHRAVADELCANKSDGTPVCVTGEQLATILAGAGGSASAGSGAGSAASPDRDASTTPDTTPPTITINGNNPAVIRVGDTYADMGARITGPADDLNLGIKTFLNGKLVSDIVVDTSAPATSTIDYVAIDNAGNTATSTRTVIVETQDVNNPAPVPEATTTISVSD